MIKARVENNLIFGLSSINVDKLKEGKPIAFNLSELGLDKIEDFDYDKIRIIIMSGETEEAIEEDLRRIFAPEENSDG